MPHFPALAAAALLVCTSALAQQRIDPSRIHPITGPILDGGVYDWDTGTWTRAPGRAPGGQIAAHGTIVYNNTCFWSGGAYYAGGESCEVFYDEGRIPSPDEPGAPAGASPDNLIDGFQFAYCTFAPTGQVHLAIGFWDNIGGPCLGGVPNTPSAPPGQGPGWNANAYFDMGPAVNLPGSSVAGAQSCWVVTISFDNAPFCLASNGDGIWNDDEAADSFNWSFESKNVTFSPATPNGPILAGEPSLNPGSCTFDIPCATDFTGNACGTGLDTAGAGSDRFWINVDNDPVGTPNTGGKCLTGALEGTDCYWFGGYPTNPYSSFWMALSSSASCTPCVGDPVTYCTAKATTTGCLPAIGSTGIPSKSGGPGSFHVTLSDTRPDKSYIYFYTLNTARAAAPFPGVPGAFLCMQGPVHRRSIRVTTGPQPCGGATSFDFGRTLFHVDPIQAGDTIRAQWWGRDNPAQSSVSNAIEFLVCP